MINQIIPKKILYWYDNNHRQLPWRLLTTPKKKEYYTLVSEFMLQQTQVKTVVPFFENFIKKIPNLKVLSKVSDKKLMKCWEGLGYYRRAHNLKKTASLIIEKSMEGYREILKTLILYLELESILQAQLYHRFRSKIYSFRWKC